MRSRSVRLKHVVSRPETWNPRKSGSHGEFRYVDIACVDQRTKSIVGARSVRPTEAPSRARQLVSRGDVLVSTVRPSLNAVAMVPHSLDGATASTGFAVLRPDATQVAGRYLYHWVRSPDFVRIMLSRATGASYPAVTDAAVRDSQLPLPPLPEQRRIAAILDKADAIRRKRQESLELLDAFVTSSYRQLVGSGAGDYSRWPDYRIVELADESPGSMRTGPFGSALRHSEFTETGIAVLGIDNVVHDRFIWDERRFITEAKYEKLRRYTVKSGDVIITIMGTTGRSAVVPEDIPAAISTKHLAVISVDRSRVDPEFLSHAVHTDPMVLSQITAENRGAIMTGLNLAIIKRLRVRLPPLPLQRRFAELVRRVNGLRDRLETGIGEGEALFCSQSQRAFSTDL